MNTYNQKHLLFHVAENQKYKRDTVLQSDLLKNYHSGEWHSQIQKQISARNSNPIFQEMATSRWIVVTWVVTPTKSCKIKPLH